MKYSGQISGHPCELIIEHEGLRCGNRFLDFADFKRIRPINHRVFIDLISDETVEISMLGFSYDGFLEELTDSFSQRSLESLFIEENDIMKCEGEYVLSGEKGRGKIMLLPDSICVLPLTERAVRIPLCFTKELSVDGYLLNISLISGERYVIGRMGYDTKAFFERAIDACTKTKAVRADALSHISLTQPYTHKGLFRTKDNDLYWTAAFGNQCCAVELFTNDASATYLYRFTETPEIFLINLEMAMEAAGIHREIIYIMQEKLDENPLYRMSVIRSNSIHFLRERAVGRIIHNSSHYQNLIDFLIH